MTTADRFTVDDPLAAVNHATEPNTVSFDFDKDDTIEYLFDATPAQWYRISGNLTEAPAGESAQLAIGSHPDGVSYVQPDGSNAAMILSALSGLGPFSLDFQASSIKSRAQLGSAGGAGWSIQDMQIEAITGPDFASMSSSSQVTDIAARAATDSPVQQLQSMSTVAATTAENNIRLAVNYNILWLDFYTNTGTHSYTGQQISETWVAYSNWLMGIEDSKSKGFIFPRNTNTFIDSIAQWYNGGAADRANHFFVPPF